MRRRLTFTALILFACAGHAPTSPTEPLTPASSLPHLAGNYIAHMSFVCRTNQDLPTTASERVTLVQDGARISAPLGKSGALNGLLTANTLTADATYTFDDCRCAVTASGGSGNFANGELQGIAFSQGTASHCQFGSFSIVFERVR